MTRSTLRGRVRTIGRVGQNTTNETIDNYLNDANQQLQEDVKWFEKTIHFTVNEIFTLYTTDAFNINFNISSSTAATADIPMSTAIADRSGTIVAAELQAQIRSLVTTKANVSFSRSTWKFTISATGAEAITITPPSGTTSYDDASFKLFGIDSSASVSTDTYTGAVAPYCTSEYTLPSDFLSAKEIRYDDKNYPLYGEIHKDRDVADGTPFHFYMRGNYIGITPKPTNSSKRFDFIYYYVPTAIATGSATDTSSYDWPDTQLFNYALIYNSIMRFKQSIEDDNGFMKYLALYDQRKQKIIQLKHARKGDAIDIHDRYYTKFDVRRYHFGAFRR